MRSFRQRFPPPWSVAEIPGGYKVMSSNGTAVAWIYALDGFARAASPNSLTHPEARAIANAICRSRAASPALDRQQQTSTCV